MTAVGGALGVIELDVHGTETTLAVLGVFTTYSGTLAAPGEGDLNCFPAQEGPSAPLT
jgi:hypothetical protein